MMIEMKPEELKKKLVATQKLADRFFKEVEPLVQKMNKAKTVQEKEQRLISYVSALFNKCNIDHTKKIGILELVKLTQFLSDIKMSESVVNKLNKVLHVPSYVG